MASWVALGGLVLLGMIGTVSLAWGSVRLATAIARRYGTDDVPVAPPRRLFTGFDPEARARAAAKRDHADFIRRQAAKTVSQPARYGVHDRIRRLRA